MKLHKFTAATFTQAMNRVRKELGEDAIIISTIEEKGLFHITAAIEQDFNVSKDGFELIYQSLDEHGLPELTKKQLKDLIRSLERKIPEPSKCLAASLDQILHFNPFELSNLKDFLGTEKPCPIALIGPPGAGKTACIAKLAIEATIRDLNPIVITLDAEKAGALAQLTSFTEALEIPFKKADTQEELSHHILNHDGLVLLDTTGLNPYDENQLAFAKEMLSSILTITVLVMPAGLDMSEAQDMIKIFETLSPTYLIVTKIDMCRRFGSVIGLSLCSGLPLAYFSHSPHISSPLVPFTPLELAQLIQFKNSSLVMSKIN
jgi:flagellar biosynthesis protein FlhF